MEKTHENDAIAMVCRSRFIPIGTINKNYFILPKRRKVWLDNPTKRCTERNGFKHFDVVKSVRKKKTVVSSVRALKQKAITLRTSFDNNYPVRYKKTKLLWRFSGVVYI